MDTYERFNAVLNGKKPDKMPFFFPTIACSVASKLLGTDVNSGGDSLHFREELSWLDGVQAHSEFVVQYHENAIILNKMLGSDIVRETWRSKARPTKKLDNFTLLFGNENGPHIVKRFFPQAQSYGIVEDSCRANTCEELKLKLEQKMLREANTHITSDELSTIYEDQLRFKKMAEPYFPSIVSSLSLGFLMSDPTWLELTALEPELLCDYYLFETEIMIHHIKWLKQQGCIFLSGGADIAGNSESIISPIAFHKIFVPALRKLSQACEKEGLTFCYRTDGNTWLISDDLFLTSGIQAYGEVDRHASMTVGSLRQKYPNLIILGNISPITLSNGSVDDVREETKATLQECGGYNYIAGPSNAIVHGTPIENIYAMIDEINKYHP